MTIYQTIARHGVKLFPQHKLMKLGFNCSPMYRRSTARVETVSEDLRQVTIRLPISYRNRNYVGSIFGGSMFSAVDPIPMVQLINLLDNSYVVWDKSAQVRFKALAREDLYADFSYTESELADIRAQVAESHEIEIVKIASLTDKDRARVFCEVEKTIYVADKQFYKDKREARRNGAR